IKFVTESGLPWLLATGEGEKLCSMLSREGQCAAVISTDTDNIVFGCRMMIVSPSISNFPDKQNPGQTRSTMMGCNMQKVCSDLELTEEQFRDFCIALGCDFNKNIFKMGPVNAFRLIHTYKSIENFPKIY